MSSTKKRMATPPPSDAPDAPDVDASHNKRQATIDPPSDVDEKKKNVTENKDKSEAKLEAKSEFETQCATPAAPPTQPSNTALYIGDLDVSQINHGTKATPYKVGNGKWAQFGFGERFTEVTAQLCRGPLEAMEAPYGIDTMEDKCTLMVVVTDPATTAKFEEIEDSNCENYSRNSPTYHNGKSMSVEAARLRMHKNLKDGRVRMRIEKTGKFTTEIEVVKRKGNKVSARYPGTFDDIVPLCLVVPIVKFHGGTWIIGGYDAKWGVSLVASKILVVKDEANPGSGAAATFSMGGAEIVKAEDWDNL